MTSSVTVWEIHITLFGDAVIIDGDKAWIIRTLGGDRCAVDYHDGNTSYEEVGSEEMHRA